MRIKEFSITRYGPLRDTGRICLSDFSLVFGKNDDGKTLTIDAIVRLLLRTGRGFFHNIERVDESPEGYLVMDYEGEEVKLPEKGYLTDIITDLTSQDVHNVFVIRNSDLSIPSESEFNFYKGVTDRLTGLRTGEISLIRESLKELGRLTRADSRGHLSDSASFEHTGSRITRSYALIDEINTLEQELRSEGFDELEEQLSEIREQIQECEEELSNFDDARKREKYQKGSKAFEVLNSAIKELQGMEVYNEVDEQLWSAAETQIKTYREIEAQLSSDLSAKENQVGSKKEKLEETEREFKVLKAAKNEIDERIEPERRMYEMRSGELALHKTRSKFFMVTAMISAALLLTSVLGIVLRPAPLFYALSSIFFVGLLVSGIYGFLFIQRKAWLAGVFDRIKLAASRLKLGGESIGEILAKIQEFSSEFSKQEDELETMRGDVTLLESQIKELKETKLPDARGKIREAEAEIDKIKKKAGVETLQKYRGKLKSKGKYKESVETQRSILETHFDSRGEALEENLSFWSSEINALEQFKDAAKDTVYDDKAHSELKARQLELASQDSELRRKMDIFSGRLGEVERKANQILLLENDYLHCDTSQDIGTIKDKLWAFIHRIEEDRDNSLAVMEVFEELEHEEEEKVSHLFGKNSPISKYFSDITGGIYEEVELVSDESGERRIRIRFKNGSTLYADQLMGGAYDQLYLSVRLALGEKLLKGGKGFFIMDDPFIKADKERVQRQIDILKRISESGWQIIYFTAKDEVKDVLKKDIQSGKVQYIPIKGIFSQ